MLFSKVRTEEDVKKLKKQIIKDASLRRLLFDVRQQGYTKSGFPRYSGKGELTEIAEHMPSNAELLSLYHKLVREGIEQKNPEAELALRKIKTKSNSGVAVISLLTKPYPCPGRCTYCPIDTQMPKSYLAKEPAAARALAHDFDPYRQVTARLNALEANGHPVDKIEIIVIGGTWSYYHRAYQEEFMIGVYRACNEYKRRVSSHENTVERRMEQLELLQRENEHAHCRVVGLSVETRPDYITDEEIKRLRSFGVTKVEIGVQHLDDEILRAIQRDMTIVAVRKATEMLRNAGFKVVYHMMINLPGSTQERDSEMFKELFSGEDFQPDMLKIYPCVVLEKTALYEQWKRGEYVPYSDDQLITVIRNAKKHIPPYVRILRVIRDIPAFYIKAGSKISNLRQLIEKDMVHNAWMCHCIRCREVREEAINPAAFMLYRVDYRTQEGQEIFLSWENASRCRLASFARLRLPDKKESLPLIPELKGAALIREVHTYGRQAKIGAMGTQSQHLGFGQKLIAEAERIASKSGFKRIAVISGVGVREYYRKLEYRLEGTYMVKSL